MQTRTALIAAILSGALAVTIVAADVAWGLEVQIDSRTEGAWETVATAPGDDIRSPYFPPGDCAGPDLRVLVTNDKPFGDTFDIRIVYYDTIAKRDQRVYSDTWSLDAFTSRTHMFQIPDSAFDTNGTSDDRSPYIDVSVVVDDLWLGTCVQREAGT